MTLARTSTSVARAHCLGTEDWEWKCLDDELVVVVVVVDTTGDGYSYS